MGVLKSIHRSVRRREAGSEPHITGASTKSFAARCKKKQALGICDMLFRISTNQTRFFDMVLANTSVREASSPPLQSVSAGVPWRCSSIVGRDGGSQKYAQSGLCRPSGGSRLPESRTALCARRARPQVGRGVRSSCARTERERRCESVAGDGAVSSGCRGSATMCTRCRCDRFFSK